MNQLNFSRLTKLISYLIASYSIVLSTYSIAHNNAYNKQNIALDKHAFHHSFKGWQLKSKEGITLSHESYPRYWATLSGVLRYDYNHFSNKKLNYCNQFSNCGYIRALEIYIDAGLGQDWSSTVSLSGFTNGKLTLGETWLGYTGFYENNEINIGHVCGNCFGLDNSSTTTWNPLMERSLPSTAFYPGDGLGFLTDFWGSHGQFTFTFIYPDHDSGLYGPKDAGMVYTFRKFTSNRWAGIVRATYAPLIDWASIWHFGISFAHLYHDARISDIPIMQENFKPCIGFKGKNIPCLVSTGLVHAKHATQFNVEMARQYGPLLLEGEYSEMHTRLSYASKGHKNLNFKGYSVQGRYLLTGEHHHYDVRQGAFDKIDINSPYGAFELCLRYDFINLNSKNIHGGSQHNLAMGWNWFINQQIRLTFNYILANIRPGANVQIDCKNRKHIDMFGLRLQVRFK